jgi:DNA-binding CsgD family transcriptional regulator
LGQNVPQGEMPVQHLKESLTERELEVLTLITKQYSSIEIADFLNISVNTVETHRKSLLRKINVKNAVGLAMYAVKNNIV